MNRVSLAHALWGAMERCVNEDMARFVRRTFVTRRFPMQRIGYLFLILPQDRRAQHYGIGLVRPAVHGPDSD